MKKFHNKSGKKWSIIAVTLLVASFVIAYLASLVIFWRLYFSFKEFSLSRSVQSFPSLDLHAIFAQAKHCPFHFIIIQASSEV